MEWFNNYFQNRTQMVSIHNTNSAVENMDYGVIQGSKIGPLIFLIYVKIYRDVVV